MDKRRALTIYKCNTTVREKLEKDSRMHRIKVYSLDSLPCLKVFHLVVKEGKEY
jgi:hypothetical protein